MYAKDEVSYTDDVQQKCLEFSGDTDGRDTFVYNTFNYYKISDDIIPREYAMDVLTYRTLSDGSTQTSNGSIKSVSENCFSLGFGICVEKAGTCRLSATDSVAYSFEAPSKGIYLIWQADNIFMQCYKIEYKMPIIFSKFVSNSLVLPSSTTDSTKKFKITVDDSGTISATEVL